MDMMEVAHAKKAQSLVSDQDYRLTLHQYTTLPDDMKVQAAKRAYALQSEVRGSWYKILQTYVFMYSPREVFIEIERKILYNKKIS